MNIFICDVKVGGNSLWLLCVLAFDGGWLQKSIIQTRIFGICDLLFRHEYLEYVT